MFFFKGLVRLRERNFKEAKFLSLPLRPGKFTDLAQRKIVVKQRRKIRSHRSRTSSLTAVGRRLPNYPMVSAGFSCITLDICHVRYPGPNHNRTRTKAVGHVEKY